VCVGVTVCVSVSICVSVCLSECVSLSVCVFVSLSQCLTDKNSRAARDYKLLVNEVLITLQKASEVLHV